MPILIFIIMIRFKDILLEDMTVDVANTIFSNLGIPNAISLDKSKLKNYYISLVKKHHPDVGGSNDQMKYINAAYDVLKNAEPSNSTKTNDNDISTTWNAGKTIPKDPKTKHMYTAKFQVQFRSVLNGNLLYQGNCDQIDFIAILNKLKKEKIYTEVEGNVIYVDKSKFSHIFPELEHFFKE